MIEKLKSENSNNKELISKMQSDLKLQGSQEWFSDSERFHYGTEPEVIADSVKIFSMRISENQF